MTIVIDLNSIVTLAIWIAVVGGGFALIIAVLVSVTVICEPITAWFDAQSQWRQAVLGFVIGLPTCYVLALIIDAIRS